MARIDELNLERYTQNLKAYVANATNEVTIATFKTTAANTTVALKNLSSNVSIDWGGEGEPVGRFGYKYFKAGTYTCRIYNMSTISEEAFTGTPLINIVIGSTVKAIGQKAFQQTKLTSIVIPENITTMGNNIFNSLGTLKTATFNANVTAIPTGTFRNCGELTSVNIPNHITTISGNAFNNCTTLTSVVIPKSVIEMGTNVFYNDTNLTIYCEATSKPSGWDSTWNSSNRPVVWGYFENKEQVQTLIGKEVGDIETAIDEIIEIQDELQEGSSGGSNTGISIKKQVFTDVNLLIPFLYTNKDKFLKLSMNALGDVYTYNQLQAYENGACAALTYGEWLGATSGVRQYMFTLEFANNIVRMTRSTIQIKPSDTESHAESLLELSYDQANAYGAVVTVYYFDEV